MVRIRTDREIELIAISCQIVSDTLDMLTEHVKPGIKITDLDKKAESFILDCGARPAFKGYMGFPATLCVSVDDEVVHGIPKDRELKNGQIVSIDVGSIYEDFYGDHAKTFVVGDTSDEKKKLLDVTRECLMIGISQVRVGNRIGDIGYSIQEYAESHGYGVVRDLVGHGIGKNLHEEPQVPNFGKKGTGSMIENGLCLAIEPMINMGDYNVYTKSDKWTMCTVDGKPSAHFEHSIAFIDDKVKILTV